MALDPVPTYPGQYNASEASNNPSGSETRREGDDQIRRMKASEKATWTNVTGAVTASHTELNTLTGISTTDPIITLPSGTIALFETNTLTGWTKIVSAAYNNIGIRINTGTITDTTYGSVDFDTCFSRSATDGHALIDAELPTTDLNHSHNFRLRNLQSNSTVGATLYFGDEDSGGDLQYIAGGVAVDNTVMVLNSTGLNFGSDAPHTHGNDMQLRYRDVCAFQKD